jgi:hypothetical protein
MRHVNSHIHSHLLKPRRKTRNELAAMAQEDRLLYEIHNPPTDAEKQEALEREDRDHGADLTGEVDARDLLDNHPPADWGR